MDIKEVREHLQGREQQLDALIKLLEHTGESHPQYDQLKNCRAEYKIVVSQLNRLNTKYATQLQTTDE